MTVGELKKYLQIVPDDYEVCIADSEFGEDSLEESGIEVRPEVKEVCIS